MIEHAEIVPKCQNCGKPLKGRIDKKFCDPGCKNEYNNRLQRDERMATAQIDGILKHNRRVLKKCLGADQSKIIGAADLIRAGLRFDYYTHHYTNQKNDSYVFCYDYGYLSLNNEECLIVRRRREPASTLRNA